MLYWLFRQIVKTPAFWYNFAVGGTSYHNVNGTNVVQPGTQVFITTKFWLVKPSVGSVVVHSGSAVLTADASGKWQSEMPCYYDLNGQYTGYFEVFAYVVGVPG